MDFNNDDSNSRSSLDSLTSLVTDDSTNNSDNVVNLQQQQQQKQQQQPDNSLPPPAIIQNTRESPVWSHFTVIDINQATCNWCHSKLKRSGNTTNLWNHLKRKHPFCLSSTSRQRTTSSTASSDGDSYDDSIKTSKRKIESSSEDESSQSSISKKQKLGPIQQCFNRIKSFKDGEDAGKLTNAILYMLAVDQLPFSTVENEGFRYLMNLVVPLYDLKKSKTFTTLMDERYITMKSNLILKLESALAYSLTCDNWSDSKNQTYLGVTGHFLMPDLNVINQNIGCFPMIESHTSDNLKAALEDVFNEFQLKHSKLMGITSDSAANIKKALQEFAGPSKQLGCFAHILSHLVPDALNVDDPDMEKLQKSIDKVRSIVTLIKRSTLASGELKRLQMLLEGKKEGDCLKLKKDMKVRWNSTLFMIERFLVLEAHVVLAVKASKCKEPPQMLSSHELDILRDTVALMDVVGCAINDISGNKYQTISLVIPLAKCMQQEIELIQPRTASGQVFKLNLQKQVQKRFENHEKNKIMTISTLLDPRFKNLHFQQAMTVVNTTNELGKIANNTIVTHEPELVPVISTASKNPGKKSLWSHHTTLAESRNNTVIGQQTFDSQIYTYLKEPLVNEESNPLEAWRTLKHSFPKIYPLAIRYLCIQASSVPCERLFSKAGLIANQQRSRLLGKRLNKLVFLGSLTLDDWGLAPATY